MGRIKTTFVKNIAKELMEKYPNAFSGNFDGNKTALIQFITCTSRKMRNLIAGYITGVKNARPYIPINRTVERTKDDRFGRKGRRRISRRR